MTERSRDRRSRTTLRVTRIPAEEPDVLVRARTLAECSGALNGESGLSVEPIDDVGSEQQSAQQRALSSVLSSDSIREPSSRVLVIVSGATPSTGFWKVMIIAAISSAAITSSLHVRLGRSRS